MGHASTLRPASPNLFDLGHRNCLSDRAAHRHFRQMSSIDGLKKIIYLDHQSSTPCDPRVVEVMNQHFLHNYGNPSSTQHAFGWAAQKCCEEARQKVAALIGARPREIFFTSGATEANNWIWRSLASRAQGEKVHAITSCAEHSSIREASLWAQSQGVELTILPVDRSGCIDLAHLRSAICPHTKLVSLIHANNELGTIADAKDAGSLCRSRGVWFHLDAAQSVGKIAISVDELQADLLSLSAHKMYGPKGIGALFIRASQPRVKLSPLLVGGGQESGGRAGTLATPLIAGLGAACEIAGQEMAAEGARLKTLSQHLKEALQTLGPWTFNGHPERRIPGTLSITFHGLSAADLYPYLQDLAVSTGSACASQSAEPSPVLRAIGLAAADCASTFRLALGRFTTADQIEQVLAIWRQAILRARPG